MASYEYDSQNQELKRIAGGTLYADMPIGSEIEYAGTTAPTGFLECDGSTYSQIIYPELYAILGTTTLPSKSGYIIKAKQIGVPADFASAIEDVIIKSVIYNFSRTITTSTPTGFTTNNFEQISLSSEMQQKNIIGASLSSDYAWVVGTANITDTSIQATWAYVAGANTTVNFKVTVFYKEQ